MLDFWVPLYLAKRHGMDLKQIAMFAWLPFLAADLGSVASGYLTRLYPSVRLLRGVMLCAVGGRVPDDLWASWPSPATRSTPSC